MHECMTGFMRNTADLDPSTMNCCAWTKLVPLYQKNVANYVNEQVNFCGLDF